MSGSDGGRAERDTVTVAPDPNSGRIGAGFRRALLTLLVLLVVAAALGLFGVRSSVVSARGPGVTLSVRYPHIARAGLGVPFEITVVKPAGFDGDVVLALSRQYLDLFDRNAVTPQPSSENSNGSTVVWRFDQPEGTKFVVSLDMSVQSGRHWGRSGSVTLLDESHHHTARVTFTTWLAP